MQSLPISICSIDTCVYVDCLHVLPLRSLHLLHASTGPIDSHVYVHILKNLVVTLNTANKTFKLDFVSSSSHKRPFHFCHVTQSHFTFGYHPQIIPVITSHRPLLFFCLSHLAIWLTQQASFFIPLKIYITKLLTAITYKLHYIHDKNDTPGNNNYDYPGGHDTLKH